MGRNKKHLDFRAPGLSSHDIFSRVMYKYTDNSMGDHNYIPFAFIDDLGLDRQFLDYMQIWVDKREAEIRDDED